MWSRFLKLFLVLATVASATIPEPAAPLQRRNHQHDHDHPDRVLPATSDRHPTFPVLARIRDCAIGFVFGRRHAAASPAVLPAHTLDGYSREIVIRFDLESDEEEAHLHQAVARLLLDLWAVGPGFADVRIEKDRVPVLMSLLPDSMRASYRELISDISRAVADNMRPTRQTRLRYGDAAAAADGQPHELFFENYQPLSVVTAWMRLIESMFPSVAKIIRVGGSYEGRDILALSLSTTHGRVPAEGGPARKTIVIVAGMHAREWIATTTANYVAWSFLMALESGANHNLTGRFLEEYDMVFVPALNPDGTEYTWRQDRLWRKTRQPTGVGPCPGFDLDHAFGYQWDRPSSHQSQPCSEAYGGGEPFESVEARALADWARAETSPAGGRRQIEAVIDLHSYSQQVLYPYSFSCRTDPPNLENLEEVAIGIGKTLRLANGEYYRVQSACRGAAMPARAESGGGGSMVDWFSHEMHAHYSLQIKLRDLGSYGFLLPRQYIKPTGREMFKAMEYLCDYLLGNNGIERSIGHGHGWGAEQQAGGRAPETAAAATDRQPELKRALHQR